MILQVISREIALLTNQVSFRIKLLGMNHISNKVVPCVQSS